MISPARAGSLPPARSTPGSNVMRIAIVGAGPAGLFLALLLKRKRGHDEIVVLEQNPADATFGFGVVFSDGALEFLRAGEPEILAALEREMEHWPEQRVVNGDETVSIDGNGFSAIGRLRLLQLLQGFCAAAGIHPRFEAPLTSLDALDGFDIVVGADGLNSVVRRALEPRFDPRIEYLTNKFAWYGTSQVFEALTLTFREAADGHFVAHHYRYSPTMSTFLVECDAATWKRAGLDTADDAASRAYCERVFARDLGGHALVSNRSIWRNFPLLWTTNWVVDNRVLIGDAVRTGHFSIGSGTRLAMEDAIVLANAIAAHGEDARAALAAFEAERKPIARKIVDAANRSSYWYETFPERMRQPAWQLAYDYMTRSGRIDDARLRRMAPRFMDLVDAKRRAA